MRRKKLQCAPYMGILQRKSSTRFLLSGNEEEMEKALFSAQIDRLPEILEWMRNRLQQKGLNPKAIRRLELALEEAIVNVIRHSYQGKEGKIELALEVDSEEVT